MTVLRCSAKLLKRLRQPATFDVALWMLETPFARKELGKDFHVAPDLVHAWLLPSAKILPLRVSSARH